MPNITLPDGSSRYFDGSISVVDVARSIGPGLAKDTLVGRVNGVLVDASHIIDADATLCIITNRDKAALELYRHDAAHVMAQAVQELYPATQVVIGPVIANGFYYDFSRTESFTDADLEEIENRMHEIVQRDLPIVREIWDREKALRTFSAQGETYKVKIIEELISAKEELSIYRQGDWLDICRGPHLPSTGKLGNGFKLMKVAGAYWRGDARNEMLQRIYGTAWPDKKQLKAYLHRLEEAGKRDHRHLARRLDLFHMQEEAPGMVFWHSRGWTLYQTVQQYMRIQQNQRSYKEINTPQLVDFSLWEKSGHAAKFSDDMFMVESEGRQFAIKPMNCPCHVQVFNQGLKSYRDLPLRLAEFGCCSRNEMSGALHGLMRLRSFTQDDAHIFCTEAQIQSEVAVFIDFLHEVYADFGFTDILYRLSTRPENRVGSDAVWTRAENALAEALDSKGLLWEELQGEGAFYGPKIEFSLRDCLERVWQCGTIQVDFSMPGQLNAQYVDEQGKRQVPVMLHRAILGSFERFLGILIEHHAGKFPLWLAPVQIVVMNITSRQAKYAEEIVKKLQQQNFRVISDLRNEKIGFRIREQVLQYIPYLLIVGEREEAMQTVAVRTRSGETLTPVTVEDFVRKISDKIASHSLSVLED